MIRVCWPQLKNELTNESIPKADVEMYKSSIQDWIREANDEGLFEDPDSGMCSPTPIHLRPVSVRALSTSSAGSEGEPIGVSRVSTKSKSQGAPTILENEDGHDDSVSIGVITFSQPIELRPLSVRAPSISSAESNEEPRPSISSVGSKGAVMSPAVIETDAKISKTKATTSISTPVDEDMPNTTQPKPLMPFTARHFKNRSTSMELDRANNEGYLAVPATSVTQANSTKEVPPDVSGDISINTERTVRHIH